MSVYENYEAESETPPDLSAFDDAYETAEDIGDEVPDGKYQVRVHTVKLGTSSNDDPMIKWDLVVVSGPQVNRHIFKNQAITTKSLPIVKKDLSILGIKLIRFSELANRLEELLDTCMEVTVKTKGEYTNVFFNRKVTLALGETIDDDSPF